MKRAKERRVKSRKRTSSKRHDTPTDRLSCGLCGKRTNLTKTECCDQWICDDEDQYVLFSYARNSCYRNHSRYTLCGFHYAEGHSGNWKNCPECKDSFETEMYVYYGTNEYNFETLKDVPDYGPTRCSKCNDVIVLSEGGYSSRGDEYFCARCSDFDWSGF
jgi:hypothetical protein